MACQRSQKDIKNKNVCRLIGMVSEKDVVNAFENVPVPACRDAIWQRLEEMLDAETESDNRHDGSRLQNWIRHWKGTALFLIGITMLVLMNFRSGQLLPIRSRSFQQEGIHHLIDSLRLSGRKHVSPNSINKGYSLGSSKAQISESLPGEPDQISDSCQIANEMLADSVIFEAPLTTKPNSENSKKLDSLTIGRKPRGVKGVADSSYRIIPQIKN